MTGPATFEDVDVRTGSVGSLLRTFVGLHLRALGGWIAVADLVELLGLVGAGAGGVRSALNRVRGTGLLVSEQRGAAGVRLACGAERMLERGDRRLFGYRPIRVGDPWVVVAFSVPESHRDQRHRLRTRLTWLGLGTLTPGAWIGPGHLADEVLDVLVEEGLRQYVTVLRGATPDPPRPIREAAAQWWDLDALARRYASFLDAHRSTAERRPGPEAPGPEAFADHLRLVDDWRAIPYLDPGLSPDLAPPDWPGHRGVELFADLHARLAGPAADYVTGAGARRGRAAG